MNKKDLLKEIEACEVALESLKDTRDKCIIGIDVQEFVLKSFKKELKKD